MFRALRAESPQLRTLLIARADAQDGELSFDEACAGDAAPGAGVLGPYPDPDAPHLVVYTSGTESTAKGCVHTWNTLDFSGRGLAHDVFRMTPDDVMFMPSPVAHATGLVVGLLVPLAVGAQTNLLDVWEPNEGLRRIAEYRCWRTRWNGCRARTAHPPSTASRSRSSARRVARRRRDIIIRGGTNISAGEVEGHLVAHPGVAAAAVVAYPDDRLGERAAAIVVPAEGATPTLEELTAYLRTERRIAPHKLPERLVVVDALPMTATGKVQ